MITYVGRIAEKNVDYLADALLIVASRRPDVRILFVGDGPIAPCARGANRLDRSFRRISRASRPGRPLRRRRSLRVREPHRDAWKCGARGDVVRFAGRGARGRRSERDGAIRVDRNSRRSRRTAGSFRDCVAVAHRPIGRKAKDGRGRPGLRGRPELGGDHGFAPRGAIKASSASRPNWRAGPDQASDARSTPYSQPTRMESGHARASLFLVARGVRRSQWTLLANSGP